MVCCCYESNDEHTFSCSHKICDKCMNTYVLTKWKRSNMHISCPICRSNLNFSCIISKGKPVFTYDNFSFTISSAGLLKKVAEVGIWSRPGARLVRNTAVTVLPTVAFSSSTTIDKEHLL